MRAEALAIIRERYADFGPTLAAEKLREVHGICLGRETVRVWMAEAGIWATRKKRRGRVYQPRYRRDCVGELIQIDGSEHRWFEERGPMCTLLVYIDTPPVGLCTCGSSRRNRPSPISPRPRAISRPMARLWLHRRECISGDRERPREHRDQLAHVPPLRRHWDGRGGGIALSQVGPS